MILKQNAVLVDSSLVDKATKKAKRMNLPCTLRGIFNWAVVAYSKGNFKVVHDIPFDWVANKSTSVTYQPQAMVIVKKKLQGKGLQTQNNFVVNFMLLNFVNNN